MEFIVDGFRTDGLQLYAYGEHSLNQYISNLLVLTYTKTIDTPFTPIQPGSDVIGWSTEGVTLTYIFGETVEFFVHIYQPFDNLLPYEYDFYAVALESSSALNTPTAIKGTLVGGSLSNFVKGSSRIYRFVLDPTYLVTIAETTPTGSTTLNQVVIPRLESFIDRFFLTFLSPTGNSILNGITVMLPNGPVTTYALYDTTVSYPAGLSLKILNNTVPYLWQKVNLDTSCTTISSCSMGVVKASPTRENSSHVLLNLRSSDMARINTSANYIEVTYLTPNIDLLTEAVRPLIFDDFSFTNLTFNGTGESDGKVVSNYLFAKSCGRGGVLPIDIVFSPSIKVAPLVTMLSPFNSATAPAIAASMNTRKIQIQVFYAGTPVGNPIIITGGVS